MSVKDFKEYKIIGTDFQQESYNTRHGIEANHKPIRVCVNLDKPNKIYTGKREGIEFVDNGDHYYTYFGQGEMFPLEKEGFAWLSDEHTVFFFERPYEKHALNILKKYLGDRVTTDNNDILIDGKKVGPSLVTGFNRHKGVIIGYNDDDTPILLDKSDPNTGRIYCLRWDDLDGLNSAFDGVAHHQERLDNKAGLTTLAEHLPLSKEEFEALLENDD